MLAYVEGIRRNVATIKAIPADVLPDGRAKRYLILRAALGDDVYACRADDDGDGDHGHEVEEDGEEPSAEWLLWLRGRCGPVAEFLADYEARHASPKQQRAAKEAH